MLVHMVNVLKNSFIKERELGGRIYLYFAADGVWGLYQGGFKTMGSKEKIENTMCWQIIDVIFKI